MFTGFQGKYRAKNNDAWDKNERKYDTKWIKNEEIYIKRERGKKLSKYEQPTNHTCRETIIIIKTTAKVTLNIS